MHILKFYSIIISGLILLSGCTSNMPKKVEIPIAVRTPAAVIPKKPHLPIADLKDNSSPDVVIKAYAASVETLQFYTDSLIEILQSY